MPSSLKILRTCCTMCLFLGLGKDWELARVDRDIRQFTAAFLCVCAHVCTCVCVCVCVCVCTAICTKGDNTANISLSLPDLHLFGWFPGLCCPPDMAQ